MRFRLAILAACCALRAPALAQGDGSSAREAKLTSVQGSVYLHLHDHPDGDFIEAEEDAPLEEGDHVRTGVGASAEVTFDGESTIELTENSDFIVNSLTPEHTEFHLGLGGFVAKIKTLLEGQKLEFHTPTAVAAVRGTELAMSQDDDDQPARVGVFDEGRVAVRAQGQRQEVALGPGQETAVARGGAPSAPGPLRAFAERRRNIERLRGRMRKISAAWRPRTPAQRRAARSGFLARPRLKAAALKNVSPRQLNRNYRELGKRRAAIRQNLRRTAPFRKEPQTLNAPKIKRVPAPRRDLRRRQEREKPPKRQGRR